ncbi:MAG: cyclic nucleotide-binding domain-containing protein, partial [Prolixibacteraceae bacterium]|nr:cyclic nucleotide-binding domain-containing protein [Prolixibacteraceae bacterium]
MRNSLYTPTPEETNLSGFKFFKHLIDTEIRKLNYDKTCQLYKKGSVVYREGTRLTGFYCVTRGILKIY